jgi:hypothetical protein
VIPRGAAHTDRHDSDVAESGPLAALTQRSTSGTHCESLVRAAHAAGGITGAFLGSAFLAGCLTQNVQYDVPHNFPSSIETPENGTFAYPLNSVIQLPRELPSSGGDGGTASSITLGFDVRDANVDQRLRYQVFVDYNPAGVPAVAVAGVIPPTSGGSRERRRVELPPLPVSLLSTPGCHRIEVLVSEQFLDAPSNREPALDGDLGAATWWVATEPSEGGGVDMTRCP